MLNYPRLLFLFSLFVLWLSDQIGGYLRKRRPLREEEREDFGIVQAATLTLLALIIGFSYSMAIERYDQRKNYEEAEANAIGTEYVRADLLPAGETAKVQALLRDYLDQRVLFYKARDEEELGPINARTAQLQSEMWSGVKVPASAQPTAMLALVVWGMNDVLNSQGYTQAAWWNRIPHSAWALMGAIAICCNLMVGYGARQHRPAAIQFVLPLVLSMAFFLIADIESPRRGLISVRPQNLESLAQSLHAH
jgi:hypothetical protein